jgi:bifunctional non-homologous end joining protein LigD
MDRLTRVKFTNLDKVLYPRLGVKMSQVIEHYIRMAPLMLSFLEGRAVVLNRYPDGVDHEGFYEKDAPRGTPDWVDTFMRYSEAAEREIDYILCNNLDTLLWLANLAALELHVTLSRAVSFENPDLVLFDLDPEPPFGFQEAVDAGFLLKEKLDALGYESYTKTSGKKGLHVLMPIVSDYSFRQAREFVHELGKRLASESEMVVSEVSQS